MIWARSCKCLIAVCALAIAWRGPATAQIPARPLRAPAQQAARNAQAALDELLKDVRAFAAELARGQDYRAAERYLKRRLQEDRRPGAAMLWGAYLGKVYSASGQDKEAIEALTTAQQSFEKVVKPSHSLLTEQASATAALADAYARMGQNDEALATLRKTYTRLDSTEEPVPADQLKLLVKLFTLKAPTPLEGVNSPTFDDEAERLTLKLHEQPLIYRPRGLKSLAEYQRLSNRPSQAIDTLREFVDLVKFIESEAAAAEVEEAKRRKADPHRKPKQSADEIAQRRAETFAETFEATRRIAELHHDMGNNDEEIVACRAALRLLEKSDQPIARAWLLHERAQIELALYEAMRKSNDPGGEAQSKEYFDLALKDYESLLAVEEGTQRTREVSAPSQRTVVSWRADAADARSKLLEGSDHALHVELLNKVIEEHQKLIVRYKASLLPQDPRNFQERFKTASLCVQAAKWNDAKAALAGSLEAWASHPPTQPAGIAMQAHTLNLMGECELELLSAQEAEAHLKEAQLLCEQQPALADLGRWVRLNLGRAAKMNGQYQRALELYQGLLASQPGVRDKLSSYTLLHLGLLQKDLLKFKDAEKSIAEAVQIRQEQLGDNEQRELIPHYIALAGLQIALRQPDELQKTVKKASGVLGNDKQSNDRLAVRHQQAMVDYIKAEQKVDSFSRRDAARKEWQALRDSIDRAGQKESSPQQGHDPIRARANHYLARLTYLDYLEEKAQVRRTLIESNKDYAKKVEDWQAALNKLTVDYKTFDNERLAYGKSPQQDEAEYRKLSKEAEGLRDRREKLETDKNLLPAVLEGAELERAIYINGAKYNWPEHLGVACADAKAAIDALASDSGGYQSLHYAALCNYAQLLRAISKVNPKGGEVEAARAALEQAADIGLAARARTVGDDRERMEFFGNFQTAFDLLVDLHVEADRLVDALIVAEQSRSLTLLDQLRMAAVDRKSEAVKEMLDRDEIQAIVEGWKASDDWLLYYYVGRDVSYAFIKGGQQTPLRACPLETNQNEDRLTESTKVKPGALEEAVEQLQKDFSKQHDIEYFRRERAALAEKSSLLLPSQVQTFLKEAKDREVSHVTVVPHGPLQRIPLEALVLDGSNQSIFLDQESPPLAYAPSLVVLDRLLHPQNGDREKASQTVRPRRLVTIGNPIGNGIAFLANSKKECEEINDAAQAARGWLGGQQPLLATAATERAFRDATKDPLTILHLATHARVEQKTSQSKHETEDLVAQITLSPPDVPTDSNDDGRLKLAEIYSLKLSGCELVMLSACQTNVSLMTDGQNAQLDPSYSLANAFLAIGARRVVASDWEVPDKSACEVMTNFAKYAIGNMDNKATLNYAQGLRAARARLRETTGDEAPRYWAPFVLIGPAFDPSQQ